MDPTQKHVKKNSNKIRRDATNGNQGIFSLLINGFNQMTKSNSESFFGLVESVQIQSNDVLESKEKEIRELKSNNSHLKTNFEQQIREKNKEIGSKEQEIRVLKSNNSHLKANFEQQIKEKNKEIESIRKCYEDELQNRANTVTELRKIIEEKDKELNQFMEVIGIGLENRGHEMISLANKIKSKTVHMEPEKLSDNRKRKIGNDASSSKLQRIQSAADETSSSTAYSPNISLENSKKIRKILTQLKKHKDSYIFMRPVTEKQAPRYFSIIKNPMDISTMVDKNKKGLYKTLSEFKGDFELMISNCKTYNGPLDLSYTPKAEKLEKYFVDKLLALYE